MEEPEGLSGVLGEAKRNTEIMEEVPKRRNNFKMKLNDLNQKYLDLIYEHDQMSNSLLLNRKWLWFWQRQSRSTETFR